MKTLHNIPVDSLNFSIKTLGVLRDHGVETMGQLDELGPDGRNAMGPTEKVREEINEILIDTKYRLVLEYAPKSMDPSFMRFDRKLDMVMEYIERLELKLTKTHRKLDALLAEKGAVLPDEPRRTLSHAMSN